MTFNFDLKRQSNSESISVVINNLTNWDSFRIPLSEIRGMFPKFLLLR